MSIHESQRKINRRIHEWFYTNYTSYIKFNITLNDFINLAKAIWNSHILKSYNDWVIEYMYLFPWQDQSQLHRIGYFSWERVNTV